MGAELRCSRPVEKGERSRAAQGDSEGTERDRHRMQPGCTVQDILLEIRREDTLN